MNGIYFILESVKAKITGHLAAVITDEIKDLDTLVTIVKRNVLIHNAEYYENQLLTVAQGDMSTIDYVQKLREMAMSVKQVYSISQGSTGDQLFPESRALAVLRRSLIINALDKRVKQAMELAPFNTIDQILTKVAEYPVQAQVAQINRINSNWYGTKGNNYRGNNRGNYRGNNRGKGSWRNRRNNNNNGNNGNRNSNYNGNRNQGKSKSESYQGNGNNNYEGKGNKGYRGNGGQGNQWIRKIEDNQGNE